MRVRQSCVCSTEQTNPSDLWHLMKLNYIKKFHQRPGIDLNQNFGGHFKCHASKNLLKHYMPLVCYFHTITQCCYRCIVKCQFFPQLFINSIFLNAQKKLKLAKTNFSLEISRNPLKYYQPSKRQRTTKKNKGSAELGLEKPASCLL